MLKILKTQAQNATEFGDKEGNMMNVFKRSRTGHPNNQGQPD